MTPTLVWSAVSGADQYRLEVNTKSDFSGTVVYDKNTVSSVSKQIGALFDNTQYYWRVTALNNLGNSSDTSSAYSFTTIKASLTFPANGATNVLTSPTLTWAAVTGADTYRLEVNTQNDFTGTVVYDNATLTTNSQTLSGLANSTIYFWRVTASSNTLSKVNTSDVYSFTTIVVTSDVPTLSSPANNSTGISTTPTLTWNPVTGADTYNLQIATDANFTAIIKDISQTGTVYNVTTALTNSTKYYWRVSSTNAGSTSSWSAEWNFTVIPPQQYSVNLSSNPTDGGTTNGGGTYNVGASVTVTATANSGYIFTNWKEGGNVVSSSSSYNFTMPSNNRTDRKSTRLNSSHIPLSRMPSSA